MNMSNAKSIALKICLLGCAAAGAAFAEGVERDAWRTWPGESVGVSDATFYAIDHKWYGIQVTCYRQSDRMEGSYVQVFYQGRGLDEYKISINGHVYDGPINGDARAPSVDFNNFLEDIRSGKPITVIDGSASETIANLNSAIIPDPFGENSCFIFM